MLNAREHNQQCRKQEVAIADFCSSMRTFHHGSIFYHDNNRFLKHGPKTLTLLQISTSPPEPPNLVDLVTLVYNRASVWIIVCRLTEVKEHEKAGMTRITMLISLTSLGQAIRLLKCEELRLPASSYLTSDLPPKYQTASYVTLGGGNEIQ